MFSVALGHSENIDSKDAVEEVINQCIESLGSNKPKAGLLLSADHHDHELVLEAVNKAFPGLELIGCTTAGEMSSLHGYCEGSMILLLFVSDTIGMHAVVARNVTRENTASSLTEAIKALPSDEFDPVCCLTLPEVFTISSVILLNELKKHFGTALSVFGAGASDSSNYTKSYQFYKSEILQQATPMLFFTGPLKISLATTSGWQPFTAKKELKNSTANIAFNIGEESALDYYQHYLGTRKPTLAHPIAIYEEGESNFYLRAPIAVDEEHNSVVFGGAIPDSKQHAQICITKAQPETVLDATREAIEEALKDAPLHPVVCLMFSCTGRQNILGTRTKREAEIVDAALQQSIPFLGFYSYNQVGPFDKKGNTFVHNETIIAVIMGE